MLWVLNLEIVSLGPSLGSSPTSSCLVLVKNTNSDEINPALKAYR